MDRYRGVRLHDVLRHVHFEFSPEIPPSDEEVRQVFIETGAAIVALGATNLIFLGMSLWRNRGIATADEVIE
jgi:hypothetical protein